MKVGWLGSQIREVAVEHVIPTQNDIDIAERAMKRYDRLHIFLSLSFCQTRIGNFQEWNSVDSREKMNVERIGE